MNMPTTQEKINKKAFLSLIDLYCLEHRFAKLAKEQFYSNKHPYNYINKKFKFGDDGRIWYKIKITKEMDNAYDYFIQSLYFFRNDLSPDLYEKLIDYSNFLNNSFTYNKNTHKIFRFLLKKNILSQETIDTLNHMKFSNNILYLCISRNPVDYLYAATDQPFQTCLDNRYGNPGQGSLHLDPNRAIVFITDGTIKSHYFTHKHIFHHFKYLYRTWVIIDTSEKLGVVRVFPNDSINIKEIMNSYMIPTIGDGDFDTSKFSFEVPLSKSGLRQFIYTDGYIEIAPTEHFNKFYYRYNENNQNNIPFVLNTSASLDECARNSYTYEERRRKYYCEFCGEEVTIRNCLKVDNFEYFYHERCYPKHKHIRCMICNKLILPYESFDIKNTRCDNCSTASISVYDTDYDNFWRMYLLWF